MQKFQEALEAPLRIAISAAEDKRAVTAATNGGNEKPSGILIINGDLN